MCMPHLLSCTELNSSPTACPPSPVLLLTLLLYWCFVFCIFLSFLLLCVLFLMTVVALFVNEFFHFVLVFDYGYSEFDLQK